MNLTNRSSKYFIIGIISLLSCQSNTQQKSKSVDTLQAVSIPERELRSIDEAKPFATFDPFWEYYANNIQLNEDFIAYDHNHKRITKLKFLKTLASGKYQPIKINPADTIRYQLKTSPTTAPEEISTYMKLFAEQELVFYGMVGKPAPKFDFKTLEGTSLTSANTKGKIVLFKCWFISCLPCVQEMPELNKLVADYKDRNDIVFISLALDDPKALKRFLTKTKFDYQTVGNQDEYIKQLNVNLFPTHFLIDQQGKVVKVTPDAKQLERFLKQIDPS